MKLTKNQTDAQALTALYRAMDRQHPVTITYTKADGTETIRTIEIYDIRTTSKGFTIVKAMDRQTGESRTFRTDRLVAYTIHRTAYTVPREQPATIRVAPTSTAAMVAYELARDERTTRHLAPAA
ncbi:WYL domain-containing protein [Streptomyces sp. CA-111067]|uniref:WYL domain-containing protein n=1 Tax=Streptomyces sp. CA-111067 TaxID=3240046 RepID=UPI003D96AA72